MSIPEIASSYKKIVYIIAPYGRDAQGAAMLLEKANILHEIFTTIEDLCDHIVEETAVLLIAEESLNEQNLQVLETCLKEQPIWSDLPIIVLHRPNASRNISSRSATARLAEELGNVLFLERPLHAITLVSAVKSALKARKRQYQTRDYAASLVDYKNRLERSNKELEQFATIASHDLQAPLRKVCMFSDFLKKSAGPSLSLEHQDYLNRIHLSVSRMQHLITDLLALSRVTRSNQSFETVAFPKIIDGVLDDLQLAIHESGARVIVESTGTVEGDPQQLHQLLSNLISNAIKYQKPDTPPVVTVTCTNQTKTCEIIVEDNGIGIKPEHHQRIFEIFQRLHGVGKYSGTGIGLAIVSRIVERHGGTIKVESELDKGARFIINLPSKAPMRAESLATF